MGILSEFFVAAPDDAPLYEELSLQKSFPADRFPRVQWKGLTSLELETLWAIADDRPWSPETCTLEPIGEPDERWLFRFPDAFVARLASLTQEQFARAVDAWSKTEELACDAREIEPVLASLVTLARTAKESGRGMFLWGSV